MRSAHGLGVACCGGRPAADGACVYCSYKWALLLRGRRKGERRRLRRARASSTPRAAAVSAEALHAAVARETTAAPSRLRKDYAAPGEGGPAPSTHVMDDSTIRTASKSVACGPDGRRGLLSGQVLALRDAPYR